MTRWLMPTIVATSLSGVVAALLNAYHRFAGAALQGFAANLLIIAFVWFAQPTYGPYALVFGAVAGTFAQLLVMLPSFLRLRRFRVVLELRHPGLLRLGHLLAPIAIGSAAGQIALFFDRYFASSLSEGTIAGMNYAVKLVGFPQQLFVTAIATVIFPLFASQFANKNRPAMRSSVSTGLRLVIFLSVPSAWGLCMLAGPIVQIAVRARGVHARSDGALRAAAALRRGQPAGARGERRADPLPVRLRRGAHADRDRGRRGGSQRAAVADLGRPARRARLAAGQRRLAERANARPAGRRRGHPGRLRVARDRRLADQGDGLLGGHGAAAGRRADRAG